MLRVGQTDRSLDGSPSARQSTSYRGPLERKPIGGSLEEKYIENSSCRFAINLVSGIDAYACESG